MIFTSLYCRPLLKSVTAYTGVLISPWPDQEGNKLMFLSEWHKFPSVPCAGGGAWWQLASRCCWNRARPWHASELVSFLVGLRTYQHRGTKWCCKPQCSGRSLIQKQYIMVLTELANTYFPPPTTSVPTQPRISLNKHHTGYKNVAFHILTWRSPPFRLLIVRVSNSPSVWHTN